MIKKCNLLPVLNKIKRDYRRIKERRLELALYSPSHCEILSGILKVSHDCDNIRVFFNLIFLNQNVELILLHVCKGC